MNSDRWWNGVTLNDQRRASSVNRFVCKNQVAFAKYFLPKHCYSVVLAYVDESDNSIIHVTGRVKAAHQSNKGKTQVFEVETAKYLVWTKSIELFTFVSGKD